LFLLHREVDHPRQQPSTVKAHGILQEVFSA
jgi:hypothetical protein